MVTETYSNANIPIIQCVPNFSEGRSAVVLNELVSAIRAHDVRLVDWSADVDHNRSVFTYVGTPEEVLAASIAVAERAVALIDLKDHEGVHPRLGAIDVLPFVPLRNTTLADCAKIGHRAGDAIASRINLPVFYYDAASEAAVSLPMVRKAAFKTLAPSVGPASPHPSAGSVAIGARGPLIAFNINLKDGNLTLAKALASELRTAFPGRVRALGLSLESRAIHQISLNIVRPDLVSLTEIVNYVSDRADVFNCELIGAMPGFAAFDVVRSALSLVDLKPEQVLLESW